MLNRVAYIVFSLLLIFLVTFSACSDKETTNPPVTCTTPGDLEVLVCDETQTNYFASADVFLYNSAAEREADVSRINQIEKGVTSPSNPKNDGAFFYHIASKKYFFFARWSNGGAQQFSGKGDALVTLCDTAIVTCKIAL
jgi:hypothetical protein